jgi:uncharacterized HAD superfamily protein/hypoxanthine phosphoribosyltransferase
MNFVTFEQLNDCIYRNIGKIPKDIELIVGIPRSGMLVANMIALYLNLPFTDIDSYVAGRMYQVGNTRKYRDWIQRPEEAKHVLVVDDSISTGQAIKEAKEKVKNLPAKHTFLAVYAVETALPAIDIHLAICHQPRMFEWNYMHHWGLAYSCMDIDGVLCEDPSFLQNDDGKRYEEFLKNAPAKIIPTAKVGYLVTCRLEKYRPQTERWLQKQGVQYDHLIMLDAASGKERRKQFSHGAYKADILKKTDCFLFIESDYEQAVEICRLSGKQVFCVANRKLITPDNLGAHMKILANDTRIVAKRTIKKLLKKL